MLNLVQRLILGCLLLTALVVGLVAVTHHALTAAGQFHLAIAFVITVVLVELGTVLLVLHPIRMVARDAKKIAQGNVDHRVEWSSRDDFGVIASESACASCANPRLGAGRWSFSFPTPFCNPFLNPLL